MRICLKAGKYQKALDVLGSKKMDETLHCGSYAHAYFGLGQLKIAHNILENIGQFNPFSQDVIAQLLLIYHDQNLKDKLTLEDLQKHLKKIVSSDFLNVYQKHSKTPVKGNFYQYQPLSLNTLSNIQNSCIYYGDCNHFNDPADPPTKLDKHFEPLNEITKNIRIACFTTKNNNILMWSHYADNHRGVCIEYDIENFLSKKDTYPISFQNVRYKKNLSLESEGRFRVSDPTQEMSTSWDHNLLGLFAVKNEDWKYEDESRLIRYFDDHDVELTSSVSIKSIYMGKDISPIHRKLIDDTFIERYDEKTSSLVPVSNTYTFYPYTPTLYTNNESSSLYWWRGGNFNRFRPVD